MVAWHAPGNYACAMPLALEALDRTGIDRRLPASIDTLGLGPRDALHEVHSQRLQQTEPL
jgi:hypothetical protein